MKTSELIGPALNWAVAKCEGYFDIDMAVVRNGVVRVHYFDKWAPTADWSQGGPIIEREGMHVDCLRVADHYRPAIWEAWPYATGTKHIQQGPTPLIAAMRCFVASRLDDAVEVPEALQE